MTDEGTLSGSSFRDKDRDFFIEIDKEESKETEEVEMDIPARKLVNVWSSVDSFSSLDVDDPTQGFR